MCAWDSWTSTGLADPHLFGTEELLPTRDHENRPTLPRPVVLVAEDGLRHLREARWGLIPAWVEDPETFRASTFNARADSLAEGKPTFREPFRRRRCLLIGTSYVEWTGEKGHKVPWRFRVEGGKPYAYAGLWEGRGEGDAARLSCTMVTVEPNPFVAEYHERMPAILPPESYAAWLDPASGREDLLALLRPYPPETMSVERIEREKPQRDLF